MVEPAERPSSGVLNGVEHVYRLRVYFDDTDAAGIVYYANYLRMAERARTEMMRLLGADHAGMMRNDRLVLTVRECAIEYLVPARLDDVLEIRSGLEEIRGASLRLRQTVCRDAAILALIRLRLACVTEAGRPERLPERLRDALAGFACPPPMQRSSESDHVVP